MKARDARVLDAVRAFGAPMLAEIRAHSAKIDAYGAEAAAAHARMDRRLSGIETKVDALIDTVADLRRDLDAHLQGHDVAA